MDQDSLKKVIELEDKFKELAGHGHPNVMNNGLFLDAVFNVIAVLKTDCSGAGKDTQYTFQEKLEVMNNLYKSIMSFTNVYDDCLGTINH